MSILYFGLSPMFYSSKPLKRKVQTIITDFKTRENVWTETEKYENTRVRNKQGVLSYAQTLYCRA